MFGFDVKNQTAFEDIFSFDTAICLDMECEQNREIYRRYAEEFIKHCQKSTIEKIIVGMKNVYTSINIEDIYFIEVFKRIVKIHHRGGITETYEQLKNLENKLCSFGFVKSHRSVLVAARHIKMLEPTRLVLVNKETVSVSKSCYPNVRDAFFKMGI